MDRPRLFRGLRIAVSAFCLIVCGLLIVLWVRSYWWCDQLTIGQGECVVESWRDRLWLIWPQSKLVSLDWHLVSQSTETTLDVMRRRKISPPTDYFGFAIASHVLGICVPHLFLIELSTTLAAAPWICWRFSLRTLLIATTLIAVVLGLVVAFSS